MLNIPILHATSFLASFLLFSIELILAKKLLPIYGGSFFVWGACVVFYQAVLLAGYAFAHVAVSRLGMERYRFGYLLILCWPLMGFPGKDLPPMQSGGCWPVTISIFGQLFSKIGPAFFVLSTVSMVLQAWMVASFGGKKENPYGLYASSNAGSFLALWSYPFFFERYWALPEQLLAWRVGYGILILLSVWIFATFKVVARGAGAAAAAPAPVPGRQAWRWLVLGMAGSVLFLSVTSVVTIEVAPLPLLWILPLSAYLLTFVLVFHPNSYCPAWLRAGMPVLIALAAAHYFVVQQRVLPFLIDVVILHIILFLACWYCQDALYRSRPRDPSRLIYFYLMFSLGSFLGGVLVSWIMPLVTDTLLEYFVGFGLVALAMVLEAPTPKPSLRDLRLVLYWLAVLALWPWAFPVYRIQGMVSLSFLCVWLFSRWKDHPKIVLVATLLLIALAPSLEILWTKRVMLFEKRNYYGILNVYELAGIRLLKHGTTIHGMQGIAPETHRIPMAYFSKFTPVGEVLSSEALPHRSVGVIGLGAGTLAAYLKPGETMDFYELDADVEDFARRYFSYLKDAEGEVRVLLGDARLSLQGLPRKRYDVFIIDAFSGDSVPAHLLTTEALELYRQRLTQDGIILFHISNRYLSLSPVVWVSARRLQAKVLGKNNREPRPFTFHSSWVAVTWSPEANRTLSEDLKWESPPADFFPDLRPWTDDYSNLLSVVDLKNFLGPVKVFRPLTW